MNIDPSILKERLSTKYKVSENTFRKAKKKVDTIPKDIKDSLRDGEGIFPGLIGEFLVKHVKKGELKNTHDYDLITPAGLKIDAKTKVRSVAPLSHYFCSVTDFNTRQKCDDYAFVSLLSDYSYGWFLGSIEKKEFYKKAKFFKKGEKDPTSPPHKPFYFKCDCYNLEIYKLTH